MPELQGSQLVLAQNQHAFVQDSTKGTVQVYAGPHATALNNTDRPVVYDRKTDQFVVVSLPEAVKQNPFVPEGSYLVLENPFFDKDGKLGMPSKSSNSPVELLVGRKINIPGPATFPLWPGQFAEAVPGHHLRSNQYLVVRVYNAEEAAKAPLAKELLKEGGATAMSLTPGQLLIIKGTETSFFIPPTGFEVLRDPGAQQQGGSAYVREALTLERLEYAILLDEDGNKRYEKGPQVVFPAATETFITRATQAEDGKGGNSRKFKAIELNDYMGLYIKVTADYVEPLRPAPEPRLTVTGKMEELRELQKNQEYTTVDGVRWIGVKHVTGEELFITGKEQRIYYQRAEHALIGYDDPLAGGFKRERYYGITIPKGEGRYLLDKQAGVIKKVEGPRILLPDPRNETVARRVLDAKTVALWYPGNAEALAFNAGLASQATEDMGYLTFNAVSLDNATRSMSRMTAANIGGDKFNRSGKYTPPPTLTLGAATKYEGVPAINVWTGYAVQVVDKAGNRRVVVGPASVLLEYDESLEVLELSTGRPKNTDALLRDVYLRVDNNMVSDLVRVETKDLVNVDLKLSYRVNFLREHKDKWFSVENYVKYMCDHMRSRLKARCKKLAITELLDDAATIVRDVVLGKRLAEVLDVAKDGAVQVSYVKEAASTAPKRRHFFQENGMEVYDTEVLSVTIADTAVAQLLAKAQTKAVETVITLTAKGQELNAKRREVEITTELEELDNRLSLRRETLTQERNEAETKTRVSEVALEVAAEERRRAATLAAQEAHDIIAAATLKRNTANDEHALTVEKERTSQFAARMAAITPRLVSALQVLGDQHIMTELASAIAPLALEQQGGLGQTLERVFKGTPLERILGNIKQRETTSVGAGEDDER